MLATFFSKLMSGDVIVTVNRRLAGHLNAQYHAWQRKSGKQAWHSADILPFNAWLERCWLECLDQGCVSAKLILSSSQEQLLWEKIIEKATADNPLLRLSATAKQAYHASQLAKQWQLPLSTLTPDTIDTSAFLLWAKHFKDRCHSNNWLDAVSLLDILKEQFIKNNLPAPQRLCLIGFDDISPQTQQFLDTLTQCGCAVEIVALYAKQAQVYRIALSDQEQEIRSAALWAKQHLLQQHTNIGIVVPGLETLRSSITRIFIETFAPQTLIEQVNAVDLPFNISAGSSLNSFPVINMACLLLQLGRGPISINNLGTILRSPFIGQAENELTARAQLDSVLRSLGEKYISLETIIGYAGQINSNHHGVNSHCPQLVKLLNDFIKLLPSFTEKYSLSEWRQRLTRLLSAIGWPGQRILNSTEHQLVQRFNELLQELSYLTCVTSLCSYSEALQHLQQLAEDTVFQAQGSAVPIQILGMLETAGLSFQHVWVMQMDDETWPPAPAPNPFLPLKLQRDLGMPHASSDRELQFCQQTIQRLLQSSDHIIFSYHQIDQDRNLQISPLIKQFPEMLDSFKIPPTIEQLILETSKLENLLDATAPVIGEHELIRGGTEIIKDQAACPFRAYAKHRLKATTLDEPELGLDAAERGSVLHLALQYFWREVQSQSTLNELTTEQLLNLIQEAAQFSLQRILKERSYSLKDRFKYIEQQRIENLMRRWIEHEKNRAPFQVIAIEQKQKNFFAGIELSVRIDRIDQMVDGKIVIIDYKTGTTSPAAWFGERPDEPQLPFYCVSSKHAIHGIVFAQIRLDDMCFKGVCDEPHFFSDLLTPPEIKLEAINTWQDILEHWQKNLTTLITQFRQGDAKLNPKEASTCHYCDLHMLCRIYQQ